MSGSHFVFDTLLRLSEFITIHCMAALDLGAGVEQPIDHHHLQQSMGRSMDLTFEDNMVDGLFFCAQTHKPQKGSYPICASRSGNVRHLCRGG